ncbi:MAG: hypothetical protein QXW01_01540 [Candidatus Aenigmatarchaeota archaeon]
MKKESREFISFFFLLILISFYFFTLGCTKKNGESQVLKKEITKELGIVIENVSYSKKIWESDFLDIRVLVKNKGDVDSKNVKIFLEGLSAIWRPPTPIERTIISLPKDYDSYLDFRSSPPVLGFNISYSFYFRVEYDYSAKYIGVFEVRKQENNFVVKINSELKTIAPIKINLTSYEYDRISNKLKLRFILLNNNNGKVLGEALLIPEDMICETTRVGFERDVKRSDREINCEVVLPKDFVSYSPQIRLTTNFRYTYNSNEYKVEVVKH